MHMSTPSHSWNTNMAFALYGNCSGNSPNLDNEITWVSNTVIKMFIQTHTCTQQVYMHTHMHGHPTIYTHNRQAIAYRAPFIVTIYIFRHHLK